MIRYILYNIIFFFSKIFPDDPQYIVNLVNFPQVMPPPLAFVLKENEFRHLRLPIVFGIIIPLTMSCFVIPLIEEYHYNLLLLQQMAGVNVYILWIVSIVWDMLTFLAFSIVYILVVTITTNQPFSFMEKLCKHIRYIYLFY